MAYPPSANPIPAPFLQVQGLGEPQQYFPVAKRFRAGWRAAAVGSGFTGMGFLTYAGASAYRLWGEYGPAAGIQAGTIPMLLGLFMVVFGIGVWLAGKRKGSQGVMVYRDGLATARSSGVRKWRWGDWASLTIDIQQHKFMRLKRTGRMVLVLAAPSGRQLVLDERLEGIQDLGVLLEQKILPGLLSKAEQRYRAGETLAFGPVQAHRESGLQSGSQKIPWEAVQQLAVTGGFLRIDFRQPDGGQLRVPVGKVPNLAVLLALAGGHPGVRVQVNPPAALPR